MKVFMEEYGTLMLAILVIGLLITVGITITNDSKEDLSDKTGTMQGAINTEMEKVYDDNGNFVPLPDSTE